MLDFGILKLQCFEMLWYSGTTALKMLPSSVKKYPQKNNQAQRVLKAPSDLFL